MAGRQVGQVRTGRNGAVQVSRDLQCWQQNGTHPGRILAERQNEAETPFPLQAGGDPGAEVVLAVAGEAGGGSGTQKWQRQALAESSGRTQAPAGA